MLGCTAAARLVSATARAAPQLAALAQRFHAPAPSCAYTLSHHAALNRSGQAPDPSPLAKQRVDAAPSGSLPG
jgi:hypothetical protein